MVCVTLRRTIMIWNQGGLFSNETVSYTHLDVYKRQVIESILETRGVKDPQEIKEFLSARPKKTYDPFIIKNMNEAVERIINHLERASKIIIYGDYDVDGITATSLLVDFFKELTDHIDYYIPNRFSEGYGLNKDRCV